jgi:hypothetical protein
MTAGAAKAPPGCGQIVLRLRHGVKVTTSCGAACTGWFTQAAWARVTI